MMCAIGSGGEMISKRQDRMQCVGLLCDFLLVFHS